MTDKNSPQHLPALLSFILQEHEKAAMRHTIDTVIDKLSLNKISVVNSYTDLYIILV